MALHKADGRTQATIAAVGASLLAVAAVLAGCMAQKTPSPGSTAGAGAGTGFFLNRDDGVASLTYGVANSDVVTLMLQCEVGKRAIEITDVAHGEAKAGQLLILASGKVESALPTKVMPNDEGGGALVVAKASPDLPALDGFRQTGLITVKLGGRDYSLAASRGEKPVVARFFSACERK